MTMDPNAPQQPGFLSRIGQGLGNLFSGYQEAPQVGGATDPFSGLSRNQRMLLGFSALRDAAASLEGRDSDYFTQALGGFEQARERERLRAQGIFQNQVQGLAALGELRRQINLGQAYGQDTSGLEAMYAQMEALVAGGGAGIAPTGGAIPTGGVVQPTAIGTTLPVVEGYETPSVTAPGGAETARPTPGVVMDADGTVVGEYTGEPEAALPEPAVPAVEPPAPAGTEEVQGIMQRIEALTNQFNAIAANEGNTSAIQTQLNAAYAELEAARERGEQAAVDAIASEDAAISAQNGIALLQRLSEAPDAVLENIVGQYQGALDPTDPQASAAARVAAATALGEDASALLGIIRQITGQEFLEAFRSLRGGGQITQIEGERALAARQRLTNRFVSPEEYRQAIAEVLRVYENALARAQGRPLPHSQTAFEEPPAATGEPLFTLDGTQVIGRID
jgi:hypothetical protein